MKKFISPGGWFSFEYPSKWNEFEDSEDCFLFYNPDKWTGNFRISSYKDASVSFGKESIDYELECNKAARKIKVGDWECAYSCEDFNDNGQEYTTHLWVTGKQNLSFECSFTVLKGDDIKEAKEIISTIKIRDDKDNTLREIIPIRLLEIEEVNSGYEWAVTTIKKQLTKDFTSQEKDLKSIQSIIDGGKLNKKQRNVWENIGIAFASILINEIDGMEWVTIIENKKEYPALQFKKSELIVKPTQLIWEAINGEKQCDINKIYNNIIEQAESVLERNNKQ